MLPPQVPVAVVIVTWNSIATIECCLSSVLVEQPEEIVVVDNASEDGTADFVLNKFPQVHLIREASNTGFAAGCNRGILLSSSEFILCLNADAELSPGYLRQLVTALRADVRAASAIGKLIAEHADGRRTIDSAGIVLCRYALRPEDRGYGELDVGQYDTAEEIFGPSGAAALYRRTALFSLPNAENSGPFDSDFFAYYEDVDLAWRLLRCGWHHLYIPAAVAKHDRRGSGGKPHAIAARAYANRYVMFAKNESPLVFPFYAPVALLWESVRLVKRVRARVPLDVVNAAKRTSRALWQRFFKGCE